MGRMKWETRKYTLNKEKSKIMESIPKLIPCTTSWDFSLTCFDGGMSGRKEGFRRKRGSQIMGARVIVRQRRMILKI